MSGSAITVQGVKSVAVPVEFIQSKTLRPAIKMLYLHLLALAVPGVPIVSGVPTGPGRRLA